MKLGHLEVDERAVAAVCRRYGIARLEVFGSVLRDDFSSDSDVDVLVEFEIDRKPKLADLIAVQQDLEMLFQRKVDLAQPSQLKWVVRERILQEAQTVFAA